MRPATERGYYIVQFDGPVRAEWKSDLQALDAQILGYVPDFAFKVRMSGAAAEAALELDSVAWVGDYQPAFKLSADLERDGNNLYAIRVESGADAKATARAIAATGAIVARQADGRLIVGAHSSRLDAIAAIADIAWVENYVLYEKHNDVGAGLIVGTAAANANGYDGSTQIAAVSDTGIGDGTASGAHPDIPASRIVSVYNWPGTTDVCFQTIVDDGAQDVDSGHGTHTAASVLSDGGPGGEGKGGAPAAGLVFQATENFAFISNLCQVFGGWPPSGYFLTGLPADLGIMYQQAYDDGARVHSNSWGASVAGDYTQNSADTDEFIWDNPDMTITFSAGNSGVDNNNNGVVDNDSIGAPATAKNVITVGASENERADNFPCDTGLGYTSHDAYQPGETCSSMGGENLLGTAGQRWGFNAEPLFSDPAAGNAEQMASFSSRGPTDDGRIKPDVVAPGAWILSGYSGMFQEGYGGSTNPQNGQFQWDGWGMPFSADYKWMGGTSMSNPIAAGAAVVVRDFYQKTDSHNASAALVKATLINSAVDMLDENNDGADDNDFPIPNVHEGWGRVDANAATDGSHSYVDDATGVGTGATNSMTVESDGSGFLKVSLVYSDFPSTENAASNLVNDLDLLVTSPSGTQYRGNVFNGGWSTTGGAHDRTNNVENVYVQSAEAGTWTIDVTGFNVPQGPQPYALVIDGGTSGGGNTAPTVTVNAPTGTVSGTVTVDISASDVEDADGTLTVEWNVDGGAWQAATWNGSTYDASWDTTTVGDGSHTINARATDSAGATGNDASTVTVDNVPDNNDPTVAINAPTGTVSGTVTVDISASDVEDTAGTLTVEWNVDGGAWQAATWNGSTYDASWDTTTVGDGAHTINARATDSAGGEATDSSAVTVDNVVAADVHVGDLDGTQSGDRRWTATVTVTIHDDAEAAVSDATVSGTWSDGSSGSCVTGAGGTCDLSLANIRRNITEVTFTVDDVSHASFTYDALLNHDPDTDSDGTSIVVPRDPPPGDVDGEVHVGDLDGSAIARGSRYRVTVTATVHDDLDAPVAGATVEGSWSTGGTGSCVTDSAGECDMNRGIQNTNPSTTFTVTNVSHPTAAYNAGLNHDPDGDSDGTSITVDAPAGSALGLL